MWNKQTHYSLEYTQRAFYLSNFGASIVKTSGILMSYVTACANELMGYQPFFSVKKCNLKNAYIGVYI